MTKRCFIYKYLPPSECRWTWGTCRWYFERGRTQTHAAKQIVHNSLKFMSQNNKNNECLNLSSSYLITFSFNHQGVWHQQRSFGFFNERHRHHRDGDLDVAAEHSGIGCKQLRTKGFSWIGGSYVSTLVSLPKTLEWKQIQLSETNSFPWYKMSLCRAQV